jgi:hypothetical protein
VVPDPVPPPRLRQPRLADMIAGRFRSQILDGSLLPGGRLPRQEALAQELGVSLTVVREALRMLEAQGLVTVHRGNTGGATVRVPDGAAISSAISTVASLSRIAPDDIAATLTALDGLCAQSAAAQPGRAALASSWQAPWTLSCATPGTRGPSAWNAPVFTRKSAAGAVWACCIRSRTPWKRRPGICALR